VLIERFYHRGLAQASYRIGCQATGEALVVDPNRDIEQYLAAAARHGLRIAAVSETHIHADYVSGARELASRAGAALYLSAAGPPAWQYAFLAEGRPLRDGDSFAVGQVHVQALHTPGHTPEHMVFLVTDGAAADVPMGMLSGDFVFVGDVGRPDLLERAAGVAGTMEAGARQLYGSLGRFRALPEFLQVWPGHGAGSACGKALGAVPQSTVGYELRNNWAFQVGAEQAFVEAVLAGQPDPPPYFAQMKRINREGPPPRPSGDLRRLTAAEVAQAHPGALFLLDIRPAEAFAAGHIPGAINLPAGDSLLAWAGWLAPYQRPIALIGAPDEAGRMRDELALIGLDAVAGVLAPDEIDAWRRAGHSVGTAQRHTAAELRGAALRGDLLSVDVRNQDEYALGHIPGSRSIPLGRLIERRGELLRDRTLVVYCQSGYRSAVAASLLQAHGWTNVIQMLDGFAAWAASGAPVAR
jgi:hydroxyacylglutathione hydrolase